MIIGNGRGNLYVYSDQGGRSNVWQGPITSNWHGAESNWELMAFPKSECDDVHVFKDLILKIDPAQSAGGRTLTIKDGGQFEVKSGAELLIKPN